MFSFFTFARACAVTGGLLIAASDVSASAAPVSYQDMLISPTGNLLSAVSRSEGKDTLVILDRGTFKPRHIEAFPEDAQIKKHVWATKSRLIVEFERSGGHGNVPPTYSELFALEADGSKKLLLYGINAGERQTGSHIKKREFARANPEILSTLPGDPDNILISYQPWGSPGIWDERKKVITKINILTGRTSNFSLEAPHFQAKTLTTADGSVKFTYGSDDNGSRNGYVRDGSEWQLFDLGNAGKARPVAVSGNTLFVLKDTDNVNGMDVLSSYSLSTGEEQRIYGGKEAQISTVLTPLVSGTPFGLVLEGTPKSYVFLKSETEEKSAFKDLLSEFSGYEFNILSADNDRAVWTVSLKLDDGKQRFYLYDSERAELKLILADQ